MQIGVLGINHKSADLALREKLAIACNRRFGADNSLHTQFSYALLTTCNRTELYYSSSDLPKTHTELFAILRCEIDEEFEHRIYSYFAGDCFFHLARVTAGMDSALVGETEIQGQVKRAYEMAMHYRRLSPEIHFLFQKCLKIGKTVRSEMGEGYSFPTLEETIVQASTHHLGDLKEWRILFVGISEINHNIFHRFRQKGFEQITFCNRTAKRAQIFAEQESVDLLPWELLERWHAFDLTIVGTQCPHFLIRGKALTKEKRVVIDLSVPRNVDPELGKQSNITLLNVDQLNRVIDRRRRSKAAELARLEGETIASGVRRQLEIFKLKSLEVRMARVAGEGRDVSNIFHTRHELDESFKSGSKSRMRD